MSIEKTKEWFELALPTPTKDNQRVQFGVFLEETTETLDAFTTKDTETFVELSAANQTVKTLSKMLKEHKKCALTVVSRQELLDALCDVIVTAVGTAHVYGLDIVSGMNEVNASNFSKFVDGKPIFNENGKIAKGPDYKQPDLEPFLGTDPTE